MAAGPERRDPAVAPLERGEALALLAILPPAARGPALLAVSGGPDSVALMHLAADAAAADPTLPDLAVATVDHGLRPEAGDEVAGVAGAAAALGLPFHPLAWTGAKPATRLQERARDARYALLVDRARCLGASCIVTAHTLDDQAETVLFRMMRGSGPAGLAGMAGRVMRDGVLHLRPLLGVAKARLVATCRSNGWSFFDDPANRDPRHARARLRRLMPALAAEGLDARRLAVLARRMRDAEEALDAAAGRAVAEAADGRGTYAAARLFVEPAAVRHRALALVLAGRAADARQRLDAVERLADALSGAASVGAPLTRTLGGCLVALDAAGRLAVGPAPPRRRALDRDAAAP